MRLLLVALVCASPVAAQTNLICRGAGTVTNHSGDSTASNSAAVNFLFETAFDEAAGSLSAKVPDVDYLRLIRDDSGVATARTVSFTPTEITASFKAQPRSPFAVLALGPFAFTKRPMPDLVINRSTGTFSWGPHSGQCSPSAAQERQF